MVNTMEPRKPATEMKVASFFRSMPNLSTTAAMNASIMDTADEIPATTRHRKKTAPNRLPPGIMLTALG